MTKVLMRIATVLATLALLSCAATHKHDDQRPGVEMSSLTTLSATVEAIDHEKRLVTLKGAEGNQVVIEVSKEARNLDQVEVGDTVEVEYYESVALFARKPDGETETDVTVSAARAPLGEKPGAGVAKTVTIKATVQAIDYDTRMIVLQGPEGNTLTTRVDERVERFNDIQLGDEIVVQYTRAFAVSVREP